MPEILEVDDVEISKNAAAMKDKGNEFFKSGELAQAVQSYGEALKLCKALEGKEAASMRQVLYRNRAAVHLKQEKWLKAETDCTRALDIDMRDPKALYRRAQAREQQDKVGEAFKDAKLAYSLEPNNAVLHQMMERLIQKNKKKQDEAHTTTNRLQNMIKIVFDEEEQKKKDIDQETRQNAVNNLLVLCRESETGAQMFWDLKLVPKLIDLIKVDKDKEVVIAATRILDELAKSETRVFSVIDGLPFKTLCRLLNARGDQWPEYIDSCSAFVQRFFNALARMDRLKSQKADPEWAEENKLFIVRLIIELEDMLTDPKVCAKAREAAIDLLLKNIMHMDKGLPRGWSWRFVDGRGLEKCLDVACQIPDVCQYPVTGETRQHISVLLARLWDDMVFDENRAQYKDKVQEFYQKKFEKIRERVVQIQVCSLLTTLMQGPVDVGHGVVANDAVTALMLEMADQQDIQMQAAACELIVEVTGKRDRASAIISSGMDVLKQLYKSKDDTIKARALVGLCKCASSGGDDVSRQAMAEGSTLKLANQCKKFLTDAKMTSEVKRFAAEGLSYLTIDADVKDWLVQDTNLIRSLVELAKKVGPLCVYSLASTFVNLTNTYKKPDHDAKEQMKKLAEFAKHHVPEEHEKDSEECVQQRVDTLVKFGATAACFAIHKTESKQCMDLLSRSLGRFAFDKEHRGTLVKEGGAKVLLRLALEADDEASVRAAQGLARIAITIEPNIAFPGQRMYEVVRPLVGLLDIGVQYLENYESLLALTNLAAHSDSLRRRILKEKPVPKIEDFWFDQNEPSLRAAAGELLLNLMHCPEGLKTQLDETTDRVKLWTLYAAYEGGRLGRAASGALVLLTREPAACKHITKVIKDWTGVLKELVTRGNIEQQWRGLLVVEQMMDNDYDVAANIIQSQLFEYLVAISKLKEDKRRRCSEVADRCLQIAERYEFIRASDREVYERKNKVSTVPDAKDIVLTSRHESSSEEEDDEE